ncbi:hypothetical protein NMY22_g12925 [Coprinellus aureogranulatus]|nr:hypothetical protein NMY22_g12925 [Coprinellus aureogranulatus]
MGHNLKRLQEVHTTNASMKSAETLSQPYGQASNLVRVCSVRDVCHGGGRRAILEQKYPLSVMEAEESGDCHCRRPPQTYRLGYADHDGYPHIPQAWKNKDPGTFDFLLSIAASNVVDEEASRKTAPSVFFSKLRRCGRLEMAPVEIIAQQHKYSPGTNRGDVDSDFITAATQGTILSLPEGGLRTELREISKFRAFTSNNVDNWARFMRDVNRKGEMRLITGHLCDPYWGIATFKGNKDPNLNMLFPQADPEKGKRYVPSETLAVTAFTISPRASMREDDHRMAVDRPPISVSRSTLPGEATVNCAREFMNERLSALTMVKAAVSHERDWCAILEQTYNTFPDEPKLVQRVFASNEVLNNEGVQEQGPERLQFLLSNAANNVVDEVKIMTSLTKDRAPSLHLYASAMWARYQVSGAHRNLEPSSQSWNKALDPRHADAMADLTSALWMRYARYQQIRDLNEVILLYRALLFSQLSNSYSDWLSAIGLALWDRYKRTKQMNDMDHAISYFRQASLSYPHPCDAGTLSNLGNILMAKARAFKDTLGPLRAPIRLSSENSATPSPIVMIGAALSPTSMKPSGRLLRCLFFQRLQLKYSITQDIEILEYAIKRLSEAKRLASPSHPKYAVVVETLVLAQRDYDTFRRSRPDYASPPPSSAASPTLDGAHIHSLRPTLWDTPAPSSLPAVGSIAPPRRPPSYRSLRKTVRIVGSSYTMMPHSRPFQCERRFIRVETPVDKHERTSPFIPPTPSTHGAARRDMKSEESTIHRVGGHHHPRSTMPGHDHAFSKENKNPDVKMPPCRRTWRRTTDECRRCLPQ